MEFRFAVHVSVPKGDDFDAFRQREQEALDKLAAQLAQYRGVRRDFCVMVKSDDYRMGFTLLDWLKEQDWLKESSYTGAVLDLTVWGLSEVFRSRFAVIQPAGDAIEFDSEGARANRYPKVLCQECGWYDLSVVEGNFKVWGSNLRRNREIYEGGHRRLVMTERVLDLFRRAVPDDIAWGPVEVVGRVPPDCDTNLFFVFPKHETARSLTCYYEKVCPACGVPISCSSIGGDTAIRRRLTLESYPDKDRDVAALGSWFGNRASKGRCFNLLHWVLGRGEFVAYLLANKASWYLKAASSPACGSAPLKTNDGQCYCVGCERGVHRCK